MRTHPREHLQYNNRNNNRILLNLVRVFYDLLLLLIAGTAHQHRSIDLWFFLFNDFLLCFPSSRYAPPSIRLIVQLCDVAEPLHHPSRQWYTLRWGL